MQIEDLPVSKMRDLALQSLRDVESMQGGANGPTIRIRAALEFLFKENFKLAAGQCPNVTGDEGGTPRCAIERERERCAEVCERRADSIPFGGAAAARQCARDIRNGPPLPTTAREIDDALAGLWPPQNPGP